CLLGRADQLLLIRVDLVRGCTRAGRQVGLRAGGDVIALSSSQDVLLADTAANAGAGDLGEIHVVLLGQLADQRGHVRQVIAGRLASGAGLLAAVSDVRACGGLRSLLARSLAGGRSLVLAGVLLLGLLLVLLLSLLGRLVLGLLLLRLFLLGRLAGAVADAGDDVADLDGVVFLSEDFDQGA